MSPPQAQIQPNSWKRVFKAGVHVSMTSIMQVQGHSKVGLILKWMLQVCYGGPAHPDRGVSTQVVSRRTVVLYCKCWMYMVQAQHVIARQMHVLDAEWPWTTRMLQGTSTLHAQREFCY